MARVKRSAARKKKSRIRRKIESLFDGSAVDGVPDNEGRPGSAGEAAGRVKRESARRIVDERAIDNVPEHTDQFDGTDDTDAPLDVVVGFDFGTSCTKIILHAPAPELAFAVPFGNLAHDSLQYLLPTHLFVARDGLCSLEPMEGASLLTDIKVGLMDKPEVLAHTVSGPTSQASAVTAATAYLALALRYARRWFIATKEGTFGKLPLIWAFNIGLPAAIDDNEKLREAYRTAGQAAWAVSKCEGPVTIEAVEREIKRRRSIGSENGELDVEFDAIPEVVAEVVGYARSTARREGLHFLMDVGASTLDICSFNLRKIQDSDYFPIFTADVDRLGARRLHFARIAGGKEAIEICAANVVGEPDPLGTIPDDLTGYIARQDEILRGSQEAENVFKDKCQKMLGRMVGDVKMNRFSNPDTWSAPLPVFICGGAGDMRLYEEVVDAIDKWLQKHVHSECGFTRIPLTRPEALADEVEEEVYRRLAVAWGLSQLRYNIGDYNRPSEIDDAPSPQRFDWESRLEQYTC